MENEMVTMAVAAKQAKVNRRTLTRAAQDGRLQAELLDSPTGKYWATKMEWVEAWKAQRRRGRPPKTRG